MMTDTTVFIADLRHNYSGVLSTDCMPLGIGYIKAVMDDELPEVKSRLFAYPDHLWNEIQKNRPDVLMLTNYMWCEQLSLHIAREIKEMDPNTLVVMGGPNLSLEDDQKRRFMEENPEIDIYCLGEGDFLATDIVRSYLDCGKDLQAFREQQIDSTMNRSPTGEILITETKARRKALSDIPSPFLTGIMDDFFDGRLAPMIETNRGCPFSCSFCVQGETWWSKVNYFEPQRIKDEIFYIGKVVSEKCPDLGTLRIADSNFGMYKGDIEISGWIGEIQAKYRYPTFIDATTGKNRPDRIIEAMEKVNNALVLYQAVQSLDEDALRNIRRTNIKTAAYEDIMIHVRGRGLRSLSDLILGLPGETLEAHVGGINKLVDAGTHEMHNFQSMMLKGADLDTKESRDKFQFTTRFRVLPKNFGIYYGGKQVLDFDEIVVATDTLPFEDYIKARTYHFVVSVFWNNSWFEDAMLFASQQGIKPSEWLDRILQDIEADQGGPNELLQLFVSETKNELFESQQECHDFYCKPENWEKLERGEIGDNLMYKYRAQASFFQWPELCKIGMQAMKSLLLEKIPELNEDFSVFWQDIDTYTRLKHAHGETKEDLLSPIVVALSYDIAAWLDAGGPLDFSGFRVDRCEAEFYLPAEAHAELEAAIKTWDLTLLGLTKGVTRIRTSAQIRHYAWLLDGNRLAEPERIIARN